MSRSTANLFRRIAAGILCAVMVFSPVAENATSPLYQPPQMPAGAAADGSNVGDGSKIERLHIQWLTKDSQVGCFGEDVPQGELDNPHNLYLSTTTLTPVTMQYQVEAAFSGQHNYAPGDIVLRIPAKVFHGRAYTESGSGVVDPTTFIDQLGLPVPEAPSDKADFNWQLVGDEYVLTNTRTVDAASTITFQFTIRIDDPRKVVDMSTSEPIFAVCEVTTKEGSLLSLTSNQLTAQVDTYAYVARAKKQEVELYDGVPENIPQELLDNLPGGAAVAGDYIYVQWFSYVNHRGNQPFTLRAVEKSSTAFESINGIYGVEVCDGIFLGFRDESPVSTANSREVIIFENGYHAPVETTHDHTIYCWTAYPRDRFRYAAGNEPGTQYIIRNDIEWVVEETDATIADNGIHAEDYGAKPDDEKMVTGAPAKASVTFAPMLWEKPKGHFEVFKYTEQESNKDYNYGYALNQLLNSQNAEMTFVLKSMGFGYPWTSPLNYPGAVSDHEPAEEDYGIYGWRQVIEDYQTFFNFEGTPLTAEDYQIASVEVEKPQLSRFGKLDNGSCGYKEDPTLPVPDLEIEYMDENGVWHYAGTAQWGEDGYGALRFTDLAEGVTAEGSFLHLPPNATRTRHSFTSNVFGGKTVSPCPVAAIEWDVRLHMELKPSDRVIAIVEKLFEEDENPSTKFKNDVRMDVYGWSGKNSPEGDWLDGDFFDSSLATLNGATYRVEMKKKLDYDPITDNDPINRRVMLHYSAQVFEESNLSKEEDYLEAVENGIIPKETKGVYYDLLPLGVVPLPETVRLRMNDQPTNVYTIANYKNTGRIMLVVEADLSPVVRKAGEIWRDELNISFDAYYSWEDARLYGIRLQNQIAFQSLSDNPTNRLGSQEGYTGEPDDPRGGNNITTPKWNEEMADAMTDLDSTNDHCTFVYADITFDLSIDMYALAGLNKMVKNDLAGIWSQGLADQPQVTVYEGQNYTYRLSVSSSEDAVTKGIVLYDTIENYDLPDPADTDNSDSTKAADYADRESKKDWNGQWQGKGQWKGTLYAVDASEFVKAGAKPVPYYSTKSFQFEDTSPNPTEAEMNQLINSGHYVLSDDTVWTAVELDEFGRWEVPEGVNVTAIALDASKTAAGDDFILGAGQNLSMTLHMTAPSDHGDPDIWLAKGAYAHKEDGSIDWYAASEPENNMYAFNNARIISVQGDKDASQFARPKMVRKDYTRVGIIPGVICVEKLWADNLNHDNVRPEEITVVLTRKLAGSTADYQPVPDADGQPMTVTLSEANNWKELFLQVNVVDENGTPYIFSFEEPDLPEGYVKQVVNNDGAHLTLTNRRENEQIVFSGEKIWEDENNAYNSRPEFVKIELYRDGFLQATDVVRPDERGRWQYSFGPVDKYAMGGREYVYTIQEIPVKNYYSVKEGSNIRNVYCPYGDLEVLKTLENATPAAEQMEFTFTLVLLQEPTEEQRLSGEEGAPLTDFYSASILRLQPDGSYAKVSDLQVTSSSQIKLRGNDKLVVKDLPAGAEYRVTEDSTPGYEQVYPTATGGVILSGGTSEVHVINRYSTKGEYSLQAEKRLVGGAMGKGQFSFELVDMNEDSEHYGAVIRSSINLPATTEKVDGEVISTAPVMIPAIQFTNKDCGKTFVYQLREKNDAQPGYTYSGEVYTLKLTPVDDGTGVITVESQCLNAAGEPTHEILFENEYAAEGSLEIKGWKTLKNASLTDGQFQFGLYEAGGSTPILTASNNQDGEIIFDPITYTLADLTGGLGESVTYTYYLKEIIPEEKDENIEYDETVYTVEVTIKDGGNGTISISQKYLDESGSEKMPVFGNAAKPGNLSIEKHVDGENPDPNQEFTFVVRFVGEDLPETMEYELSPAGESISRQLRQRRGEGVRTASAAEGGTSGAEGGTSGSIAPATYVLSAEEEPLMPLAWMDADGKLTIFRAAPKDPDDKLGSQTFTFPDGKEVCFASLNSDGTSTTNVARVEGEGGVVYYNLTKAEAGKGTSQVGTIWSSEKSKFTSVTMEAGFRPANGYGMFSECVNLTSADLSKMDMSRCSSLANAFYKCSKLPQIIGVESWDTGNVTTLRYTFRGCSAMTALPDVSNWNTGKVTTMSYMFAECTSAVTGPDLTKLDLSKVTNFERMFYKDTALQSVGVSGLKFPAGTTFAYMFANCTSLTTLDTADWEFSTTSNFKLENLFANDSKLSELDTSKWNLEKCTSLSNAFSGCKELKTLDVSNWDLSNCTNLGNLFYNCYKLDGLDVSNWSTENVTNMNAVFSGCQELSSLDVSGWKTDKVTSFGTLFNNCWALGNLDLSGWNTANSTSFTSMFYRCNSMTLIDVSSFDTSKGTNFQGMFNLANSGEGRELILGEKFDSTGGTYTSSTNSMVGGTSTTGSSFSKVTISDKAFIDPANTSIDPPGSSPYTGKWVSLTDPSAAPLTTKELFGSLNNAGTWVWQTRGYDLVFAPGGGSGAMNPVSGTPSQDLTVTNSFVRFGHKFTGFMDGSDAFFPVNGDGSTVTIPANTYSGGTITMTAQWEKLQTNVDLTNGMFTFTLHAGEKATFEGIPAGTAYEVWEETPDGWKLVSYSGADGVIVSGQTSQAKFYNEYSATSDTVDVTLRAGKTMDGKAPAAGAFSFTLAAQSGNYTDTKQNSASGAVVFDPITYDADGTYRYTITETVTDQDGGILYDETVYSLKVVVATADGRRKATVTYYDADGSELSAPPVFTNTTKPGSLTIGKETMGATAAAAEEAFTVNVTFTTADNMPFSGVIKNGERDVTVSGGVCSLTLKGGESVTLSHIPAGVRYAVAEEGEYLGWQLPSGEETGTIAAGKESSVTLVNAYTLEGHFVLDFDKVLDGRTLQEDEFTFQLHYDTVVLDEVGNAEDGTIRFSEITVKTALEEGANGKEMAVSLYYGSQTAPFARFAESQMGGKTMEQFLKQGFGFEVTEKQLPDMENIIFQDGTLNVNVSFADETGKGQLTETVACSWSGEQSGNHAGDLPATTFLNKVKRGSITVGKQTVNAPDQDAEFTFTLELTSEDGTPYEGEVSWEFSGREGATGVQDKNRHTFTLKGGEEVTISGIPTGCTYTITEAETPAYTAQSEGASGTVTEETAQCLFVNTYTAEGQYAPQAKKELSGKTLEAGQFTFAWMDESGLVMQTASNDGEGNVAFLPVSFTLEDVGQKTYTLQEISSEEPGYTYDKTIYTIEVNIADAGDGTLLITDNAPEGGFLFENAYSDKVDFTVTKNWQDEDDRMGLRPEKILVSLYCNRQPVDGQQNIEVTPDENGLWQYTFRDLPAFDENGFANVYTAREIPVEGYASTRVTDDTGATITNTLLGVLTLEKVVEGTETDESFAFTITLEKDGEPYSATVRGLLTAGGETVPVSAAADEDGVMEVNLQGGSSLQLIGLPIGLEYTVTENAGAKYESEVTTGSREGVIISGSENKVVFTNTLATVDITVNKVWNGGSEDIRPDTVAVKLLRTAGGAEPETAPIPENENNQSLALNGEGYLLIGRENSWTITVTGLPLTDEDGNVYAYTAVEQPAESGQMLYYISEVTTSTGGKTITVTNTPAAALKVKKQVLDHDGNKVHPGDEKPGSDEEFNFSLMLKNADGTDYTGSVHVIGADGALIRTETPVGGNVTFTLKNEEELIFTGMPAGARYTLSEQQKSGYVMSAAESGAPLAGEMDYTIAQEGEMPVVEVENRFSATGSLQLTAEKSVEGAAPAANEKFTFVMESVSQPGGEVYQPEDGITQPEAPAAAAESLVPGSVYAAAENSGSSITFPEILFGESHLGTHYFRIYEKTDDTNNYTEDLTAYYVQVEVAYPEDGEGQPVYDGTLSVTATLLDAAGEPVSRILFDNGKNDASITVTKQWSNADGTAAAPEGAAVTLELYAGGVATGITVTLDGTADEAPAGMGGYESAAWEASFITLPKYRVSGGEKTVITYTARETAGYAGYDAEYASGEAAAAGETIRNVQKTEDAVITKKWINADGSTDAPENAAATLTLWHKTGDGEWTSTGITVTLDGTADEAPAGTGGYESAAWEATFQNLPDVEPGTGKDIVYRVREDGSPAGYAPENETAENGETIVNRQQSSEFVVTKKWLNADGTTAAPQGASVQITLTGTDGGSYRKTYTAVLDGSAEEAPTATGGYESSAWEAKFVALPLYTPGGSQITYTAEETAGYPGYTDQSAAPAQSGDTILNKQDAVNVTVTKSWENADGTATAPEGAQVTFTLYAAAGDEEAAALYTAVLDGTADEAPDAPGGYESSAWEASFISLPKYRVTGGEKTVITYTVRETAGYTGYDAVYENGDAALDGEGILNREYTAQGQVTFEGEKTLTGRDITADDVFTFTVTEIFEDGTPSVVVATGESDEEGCITFETIHYTLDDEGTHTYLVTEDEVGMESVSRDDTQYTVTVTVTDLGDGTLAAEPSENASSLDFTNVYTAEGSLQLSGSKLVNGAAPAEDENGLFSFALTGYRDESQTVSNHGGSFTFEEIAFTLEDVGETITYTIVETGEAQGGYELDKTEYTIEVTLTDLGDGNIDVSYTVNGAADGEILFDNPYSSTGELQLSALKTVNGEEPSPMDDGLFTFTLYDENDQPIAQAVNDGGLVTFDKLCYTLNDAGKTFVYTLKETTAPMNGFTMDEEVYTITVKPRDRRNGTLEVVPLMLNTAGEVVTTLTFDNLYEAEGELQLTAAKLVNGEAAAEDEVFSFVLEDENGTAIQEKQNQLGVITFDKLCYSLNDAGKTFVYFIRETTESTDWMKADESVYTVNVTVTDKRTGELAVDAAITKDGEPAEKLVFDNTFYVPLTISKEVKGHITDRTFNFTLHFLSPEGEELPGTFAYTGHQEGSVESGGVIALKGGETVTIMGLTPGTRYIVEEEEYIGYNTSVVGEAGRKAEGTLGEEGAEIAFVNQLKVTQLSVTKVWDGGYGGSIRLTLYANGEKLENQPACKQEGDVYSFTNLPQYDENGQYLVYSAKEKYVDGYVTIYKNTGDYEEETGCVYDGGTIINRKVTTIRVQKIWEGLPEGKEPPAITLVLYCNGEPTDRKTPTPDDEGWYVYKNLPAVKDGEKAVYYVVEEPNDRFSVTYVNGSGNGSCAYDGGKIINTLVPYTGDDTPVGLWSLICLAAAAAFVLAAAKRKNA